MTLKKNGLNDSDKILVTIALWITAVTLFITAFTLPMLPSRVTIFYHTADLLPDDSYSKYNNLLLILITVVPMAIIMAAAAIKRHNRLQNNFMSVMLFSIMLSVSISCIVIYGISQQFSSSSGVKSVNVHGICVLIAAFVLSLISASFPAINHRPKNLEKFNDNVTATVRIRIVADKFWSVGAYGYLAVAVAASFVPEYFAYIPLGIGIIAHVIFLVSCKTNVSEYRAEQIERNM